jgi:hypothetical protein
VWKEEDLWKEKDLWKERGLCSIDLIDSSSYLSYHTLANCPQ